jgi:dTDP-4-amino-4,6-dideoxygalactose transaminase
MQEVAYKNIPMLNLKAQYELIGEDILQAVKTVLESQQYILGPAVSDFELMLASYCGCEFAVGCASGSDALLLALMAFDIGVGDEVITTPFTFFATAGSIARVGARPVFVDINPGSFNIAVDCIEAAITKQTRAIVPVHLFGQCAEMDRINELAAAHNLAVIEDAAQALGAHCGGSRAGAMGDIGAFSFYPSKNLGAAGDGGAVTTNSRDKAEKLRILRSHGAQKKYYNDLVGINSRLDTIQAALLMVKMEFLDVWTEARRRNAKRYRDLFHESGLVLEGKVRLPVEEVSGHHVYNQFVIRAKERDKLREYLRENGIGTEIYYPHPLHLQACFGYLGYKSGSLPHAEEACLEALAIPIYPELEDVEQKYVVDIIVAFYA